MLDARSRVTVVGARKRVDVALPTTAPIGEYVDGLAELCGQDRRNPLPHAWSLAAAGHAALALDASLGSAGVTDGQILYLRDLARDPDAEPVIEDVGELVAVQAKNQRDNAPPAGLVVMTFGLLWVVVTSVLALRYGGAPMGGATSLTVTGLALIGFAWSLSQRELPVPSGLRLAAVLAAVPCLAAAGVLVAVALAGGPLAWVGAIVGANVAGLMALAAVPEAVLVALEAQLAVAALVSPLLIAAHAGAAQSAAAVVIVALAFLGLSKVLAAAIAAWSQRPSAHPASLAMSVTELLIESRRLLSVVTAGPALALAAGFVVLATARDWFAVALVAVAALALLVRARQRGFTSEIVQIGGAGVVGAFCAATALMNHFHVGAAGLVAILAVLGLALMFAGLGAALMRSRRIAEPVVAAGPMAGATVRPERHRFIDVLGVLCHIASVSLALGVFGVFGDLVGMGRGMVG